MSTPQTADLEAAGAVGGVPQHGALTDRQQWAADMRRRFSPAAMLNADGSINQHYFSPGHQVAGAGPLLNASGGPLLNRGADVQPALPQQEQQAAAATNPAAQQQKPPQQKQQ